PRSPFAFAIVMSYNSLMAIPSKEVVGDLSIREGDRLRTPRSALARAVGEEFLKFRGKGLSNFVCNVPLLFGTKLSSEQVSDIHTSGGIPIEYDPEKYGFVALSEAPGSTQDEKLLRGLLLVGKCGTIPITAKAYKTQLLRKRDGVFYRTVLTETDGLVWFEVTGEEGSRSPYHPRLMIFPQESLDPVENK
ncbi:MAG: hypothetical protein UU05_C0033G0001, partial [Candidatus Curtissbacteria bacterium GW2011_GWA1_40_47]